MIVVDTSAIMAIDLEEPGAASLVTRLQSRATRLIPASAVLETTMVLSRTHGDPKAALDGYIAKMGLSVIPIDDAIVAAAQQAFLRFGKGRHPAGLNVGDCFSYALSRSLDQPLLFKGNDFPQTDVECHPASRPGNN